MRSFKLDYSFGKTNEDIVLTQIQKFFTNDGIIKKEEDTYSKYDFKGDTYLYELKSRNVHYKKFATTIIPYDKIIENTKQIFLFNFIDGLYYIEYDKDVFSKFELSDFQRHKREDYNDIKKLYFHIPIKKLIKIDTTHILI
jgi:hypothetical protein